MQKLLVGHKYWTSIYIHFNFCSSRPKSELWSSVGGEALYTQDCTHGLELHKAYTPIYIIGTHMEDHKVWGKGDWSLEAN